MLGLAFRSVRVEGPLGSYPAWFVTGRESTWVIYVHGRAANRAEGLRSLDVLARRGLPGLLITYRNDEGAPRSADGRYRLGLTEWQDLAAAVRYALDHGARDVVIEAYSMGGQIALQFMRRSPLAARVRALVLESPVLDWNATLALRARNLGIPGPMTWLGKTTASARVGLDWSQLDQVTDVRPIRAPVLLFHNLRDHFTPESSSEAFARARPDSVTLIRVARGNHVEAWNADSAGYAAVLGGWLAARGVGAGPR